MPILRTLVDGKSADDLIFTTTRGQSFIAANPASNGSGPPQNKSC